MRRRRADVERVERRGQLAAGRGAQPWRRARRPHRALETGERLPGTRALASRGSITLPFVSTHSLEIVGERGLDRLRLDAVRRGRPRQPGRRRSLARHIVLRRSQVTSFAGERQRDQHGERRPQRRHEWRGDAKDLVLLGHRHEPSHEDLTCDGHTSGQGEHQRQGRECGQRRQPRHHRRGRPSGVNVRPSARTHPSARLGRPALSSAPPRRQTQWPTDRGASAAASSSQPPRRARSRAR